MAEPDDLRNYWPRIIVCLIIGIVGLATVPFTGTRYGDFPEMCALMVGVLPLLYLALFVILNLNRRLTDLERRR